MKLKSGLRLVSLFLCGFSALSASSAWAVTALKQIRVTEGSRVEMDFDGKLKSSQIKTEFFNDVIQISLSDVSVYPAKIFSVSGPNLAKVFAYQYSPKLVRARLTVKGKAEAFKDRVSVQVIGNSINVVLSDEASASASGAKDQIHQSAAQAVRADSAAKAEAKSEAKSEAKGVAPVPLSTDEKSLLDKVLTQPVPTKESLKEKDAIPASTGRTLAWGKKTEAKASSSVLRILGMLGLVLGVFLAFALILKQAKKLTGPGSKRFNSMLGRFVRVKLGHREKMIDVVATHYLGPKKSIAVVRVCGRLLVLGVSNDSINLISQLADPSAGASSDDELDGTDFGEDSGDLQLDQILGASIAQAAVQEAQKSRRPAAQATMGAGAMSAGPAQIARPQSAAKPKIGLNAASAYLASPALQQNAPVFSGNQGRATSAGPSFSGVLEQAAAKPNFKDQIRSRLEGMKQL